MTFVPISRHALSWAVETSGIPKENLDEYFNFPHGTIDNWITGKEQPNLTQFKRLASRLKRPDAVFFMDSPPPTSELVVELRSSGGVINQNLSPTARHAIRDAVRVKKFIGDIQEELGVFGSSYPNYSSNEDPESIADKIRKEYFGVSFDTQMSWTSASTAFRNWRVLVEKMGILVFLYPIGIERNEKEFLDEVKAEKELIRGFSIVTGTPPAIGVSTTWNASVRNYTLFHELGHILTRTSSACAEAYDEMSNHATNDYIERWCEKFAASFLMPKQNFVEFNKSIHEPDPIKRAGKIANKLSVSRKAALIRLIEIGSAQWEDYRRLEVKFDRKGKGGQSKLNDKRTRAVCRQDTYGSCLSLVREAYSAGIISELDIWDYVRVSSDELV
ncbi:MAG: ImmA/IrrE family metallo-endopeptidase [Gammaproteobacteria bacterium]|nr:ImmA/IrrE family metallo-endopeptidase [Gammaproteobacteria bacterium]MDE0252719.1 ImmA/IrrE family metallo-endopeptidase [Gammaproteobacteria bacterium]MDE0402407.1 ImmA/IrrE family metallo-endopeptidase [Gammaproteobacteria bacterium]